MVVMHYGKTHQQMRDDPHKVQPWSNLQVNLVQVDKFAQGSLQVAHPNNR